MWPSQAWNPASITSSWTALVNDSYSAPNAVRNKLCKLFHSGQLHLHSANHILLDRSQKYEIQCLPVDMIAINSGTMPAFPTLRHRTIVGRAYREFNAQPEQYNVRARILWQACRIALKMFDFPFHRAISGTMIVKRSSTGK
jgi:hypothetical protein